MSLSNLKTQLGVAQLAKNQVLVDEFASELAEDYGDLAGVPDEAPTYTAFVQPSPTQLSRLQVMGAFTPYISRISHPATWPARI